MSDYTIEQYDNASETRAWFERFLREHNGSDWELTLPVPIEDFLTGNLPKAVNGEVPRIFWYRIKYKGVLVGYADAKIQPPFNGRRIISDVWILPKYRKRGHFHACFPALVEATNAVGICIMWRKYAQYGWWFELFGFGWTFEYDDGSSSDSKNPLMFQITRDAFKDLMRFLIKYMGVMGHMFTGSVRVVFEEVQKELKGETR